MTMKGNTRTTFPLLREDSIERKGGMKDVERSNEGVEHFGTLIISRLERGFLSF
jgi:hypothetical protein